MEIALKSAENLLSDWQKSKSDEWSEPMFAPIKGDDGVEIDPIEKIIEGIRLGFPIEEIANWINENGLMIDKYQLTGLYYKYGQ